MGWTPPPDDGIGVPEWKCHGPLKPEGASNALRTLSETSVENLRKATLDAAVKMGAVRPREFERVTVETTVQEKAMAHPVDSRLLEIGRHKVATTAKRAGIALKQTYAREGKQLRRKAGGYWAANQKRVQKKCISLALEVVRPRWNGPIEGWP